MISNKLLLPLYQQKEITMKPQLGKYYYAPLRNYYAVWQWTSVSERGAMGSKVKEFFDIEEAREYVWKMNGWGKPSKKLN